MACGHFMKKITRPAIACCWLETIKPSSQAKRQPPPPPPWQVTCAHFDKFGLRRSLTSLTSSWATPKAVPFQDCLVGVVGMPSHGGVCPPIDWPTYLFWAFREHILHLFAHWRSLFQAWVPPPFHLHSTGAPRSRRATLRTNHRHFHIHNSDTILDLL